MGDEVRELSHNLGFCPMGNGKSLINFKQNSELITFVILDNSGYNKENSLDGMMASFTGWGTWRRTT